MRPYNEQPQRIPARVMRSPGFGVDHEFSRLTQSVSPRLLGGTVRLAQHTAMNPTEKLYVQMTVRMWADGSEDVITRLYSESGPVDSVRKAKPFNTLRAALNVVREVTSVRTKDYQVINADVRTENQITVGRGSQERRIAA